MKAIISNTLRLLRLQPASNNGTVHVRCELQAIPKFYGSRRHSKMDTDVKITDDGLPKDYRLHVFKVSSRRLDSVISKAIGKGRGQTEKLILTGKVQINEEDTPKKVAYYVQENDIIDIWKQPVEGNIKLAEVHRVEIINYTLTEQGYDINLKSWKNFYVRNWLNKK
uniref:RNA-binding S4 domain-containing protein n=1 Tax=Setaria digitata TaxID=48799 RepID=A0A915Q0H7_9BILA